MLFPGFLGGFFGNWNFFREMGYPTKKRPLVIPYVIKTCADNNFIIKFIYDIYIFQESEVEIRIHLKITSIMRNFKPIMIYNLSAHRKNFVDWHNFEGFEQVVSFDFDIDMRWLTKVREKIFTNFINYINAKTTIKRKTAFQIIIHRDYETFFGSLTFSSI